MDRNNRTLKLLRDYSEKLKKELNDFVKEKEKAVKDYGISLNVERDSAKELMNRLQLTEGDLADKAASVARIDNQIKIYENSLAELDQMTSRVQENMSRVRDESAFVESTGRRVSEVKNKLLEFEKNLEDLENRFKKENAEMLEKTSGDMLSGFQTRVSQMGAAADAIGRKVEEHRLAIKKTEEARAAVMTRDTEYINKILSKAVEQAVKRADKMEDAALSSLKQQAEDRILKLKNAEEEKIKGYHESARSRVFEVQSQVKDIREEWRAERNEWELRDKALRDERKKDILELNNQFQDTQKRLTTAMETMEKQMGELSSRTNSLVSSQEELLQKTAEEMKQKALELSDAKLEEYRHAQDAEFRRLETLADDARNLDAELRRDMLNVVEQFQKDFSVFEDESAGMRKTEAGKFTEETSRIRQEMAEIGKELTDLKSAAYENVSKKLEIFESEFFIDLSRRSSDIDKRFLEWQENLESRLSQMDTEAEAGRKELERVITEDMRKNLSAQDAKIVSELEHLKTETSAFEEAIRGQMSAADDSVSSFKDMLDRGLEEVRKEAEVSIRAELGKNTLAAAEVVKQYQRELDERLREVSEYVQARNGELSEIIDSSKSSLDEARDNFAGKIRELDDSIEDARRRVRDLSAETDGRISQVRSSVEDAERHIREAVDQTKLIDKAEALRLELERRIEDLKDDINRLDQRRAEAAQLENDFVKIKRLEDDVNAKMTRFLSEKRRIETMETDFNRLLQISRAVEEKLTQVTASDDVLQGVQLQIRKLEEALGTTEDKYQRIERKSQILDNTNDGIDRNFRILQESEKISTKIDGDLSRYVDDLEYAKTSIEKLAFDSEKVKEASERIEALDNMLVEIDERISSMQKARKWIADAETRLEELNKQAQIQAKAIDTLVKGSKSPLPDLGPGAPPQQKKENVIRLARQGWTVDQIAKTMKISRGEVELILEMMPRD